MEQHLSEHHPEAGHNSHVDKLVSMSQQTSISACDFVCPLCQESLASYRAYQTHVGRHQQDLSMFALPSLPLEFIDDDENPEADQDDMGSTSSNGAVSERDLDPIQEPEKADEDLYEPSTNDYGRPEPDPEVIEEIIKQGMVETLPRVDDVSYEKSREAEHSQYHPSASPPPPPPEESSGEGSNTRENGDMKSKDVFREFFMGTENEKLKALTNILNVPSINTEYWDGADEADLYGVEVVQNRPGDITDDKAEGLSNPQPSSKDKDERSRAVDHGVNELGRNVEEMDQNRAPYDKALAMLKARLLNHEAEDTRASRVFATPSTACYRCRAVGTCYVFF